MNALQPTGTALIMIQASARVPDYQSA